MGVVAQTPAELSVQTYAGLTLRGTTGAVYAIEYVTDLAQSNNPTAWRFLDFLQLPASPYLWVDRSAPATSKRFYGAAVDVRPGMAFVPPGTFWMGSPTNEPCRYDSEGPQVAVIISRGFWLSRCEVTQAEYSSVVGLNPSLFTAANGYTDEPQRPVDNVRWEDATNHCGRLTRQERIARRIPTNAVYRLPTSAEWEYACRAWTSTACSFVDPSGESGLSYHAWFDENAQGTTHPVGRKWPNAWGLHDMYGNVWEWCQDWQVQAYQGGIQLDPQGPDSGLHRALRGGGWYSSVRYCRSAMLADFMPEDGLEGVGFRVVLAPGPP